MIKTVSREQLRLVRKRLERLYGTQAEKLLERFVMMIGRYGVGIDVVPFESHWEGRRFGSVRPTGSRRTYPGLPPLAAGRQHEGALRSLHFSRRGDCISQAPCWRSSSLLPPSAA